MKKEFIVERQGRHFVLYAGLLAEAHAQGLQAIRTELLQVPSGENQQVAICRAEVVMARDGQERVFTGIGDAAPNNVAPAMQTCLIRMAETRAKARALRDAVNVGVAALEELGEADALDGAPERGYALIDRRSRASRTATAEPRTPVSPPAPSPSDRITEQQQAAIRNLCKRHHRTVEAVLEERYRTKDLTALTQAQASELIRALNQTGSAPAAMADRS
ncbi:MAG: hypothetical protein RMJ43_03745 [Chloroherpetonaceae bacterium]|nr:hypothetical protein [Chthonomonadaceae bacterium]MDW8206924.1 hypothetical protein [Chloroherpetonaceae bacterium]